MEYLGHIPNIVDDFFSDGPLGQSKLVLHWTYVQFCPRGSDYVTSMTSGVTAPILIYCVLYVWDYTNLPHGLP